MEEAGKKEFTPMMCNTTPEWDIINALRDMGRYFGTAESCTGGNIAHKVTACPGASECFKGGIVAYSNSVKVNILGVRKEDIEKYGAVSEEVVEQMAKGALKALDVRYAVATSGIAGPGGGTEEKPVGTVCMAVACPWETRVARRKFEGNRAQVIEQASQAALFMLLGLICK